MGSWDVPPATGRLSALPADEWALLLIQARAALQELPDDPDHPARQQLRGLPTGRLAGGKARERLVGLLATDTKLWRDVVDRLEAHPDGAVVFEALVVAGGTRVAAADAADGAGTADPAGSSAAPTASSVAGDASRRHEKGQQRALEDARRRASRDRERLAAARRERDEAHRRAESAERRAEAAEAAVATGRSQMQELEAEVAELRKALEATDRDRDRAVDRERRRRTGELDELRATVARLRRAEEQRRAQERRGNDAERRRAQPAPRSTSGDAKERPSRLVPGRPSRLPTGVVPGTREAVELFLHRGRRVLVDGYNVSLQHQPTLELEQQRAWLVNALANLARTRRVVPTVVFDGARSGGQRRGPAVREVTVRFSAPGVTADDEIVLEVEATDDPILVVTDDRELLDRVRRSGADTIASRELVWML